MRSARGGERRRAAAPHLLVLLAAGLAAVGFVQRAAAVTHMAASAHHGAAVKHRRASGRHRAAVTHRARHAAGTVGLAVDASVITHQSSPASSITSGPLSTTSPGDLLVAFIASDGPNQSGAQSFSPVTGGGLTWRLRERTNGQPGTAEIWEAVAPTALSGVTVTATRQAGGYGGSIVVAAFRGADTVTDGALGTGNGTSGAPTATLTTTIAGSWVWGIGDDWDGAVARTPGAGQTIFDQYLAPSQDTYWTQEQTSPGNPANTAVTLNDTAPTNDHWNLSTIEIRPAASDTTPPTVPANLTAAANSSNQVSLSWSPSTDNVGVAGYYVFRNGARVATTTSTTYLDNGVSPSTMYTYTVEAFDGAGNLSPASNAATVTTPAASGSAPVISGVTAVDVTSTSATVMWATDIPSSSQVLYGTSPSYGQSTGVDGTQVINHAQTVSGLTPGTTYHFAVQSTGASSNTSTSADSTFVTLAASITLPDMQLKVPTSATSIGTNSTTGHRQLQFTHITWDAGTGPFEIDPTYSSQTGMASFRQAIYKSTQPGAWSYAQSVPVVAPGIFNAPSDYNFPLTRFTLNAVNSNGSVGPVVATSPKTDYCITADTYVGGVPNTPNSTFIPISNCTDPTKPLGWSVGWGDQYDQTDAGQPIDLTGVPDGTYTLVASVDPLHVLTESDRTNNVTQTKLQISGNTVAVLSQSTPVTVPPAVSLASPSAGANVSGTVTLQATAVASRPATVASVQFLLDGQPLGSPVTTAPYTYSWMVGSTPLGAHSLSARVTDSNGITSTAPPVSVNVVSGGGGGGSDTTPPTVSITNPVNGQTVSGTIPVAATATDDVAVASVQFFLDGKPLGSPVTGPQYAISWDTTTVTSGQHVLSAQATDTSGNVGTSSNVNVTVQNPAPPMTCFVMQAKVSTHATATVATTPSFHTAAAGEVLLAFVAADGPAGSSQSVTVSGAGLTWKLVKRANAQAGDSEVWAATAPSVLSNATVTSTEARRGYSQNLTVIAMEGASGAGAAVAGSGSAGAPSVSLTTTGSTSLVFAVGNDWDNAIGRTFPSGWTMLDQWINTGIGDTYWSQYTNSPTGAAGSVVNASDTAPTTDRWNLVAVELLNGG
jgi:hypothetical protein